MMRNLTGILMHCKVKIRYFICQMAMFPLYLFLIFSIFIVTSLSILRYISTANTLSVLLLLLIVCILYRLQIKKIALTTYFAVYQLPCSQYEIIAQYANKTTRQRSCSETLRALVQEQYELPEKIPQGQYKVITHETVLRRLKQLQNVAIISCVPIGMDTLEHTIKHMHCGIRCNRCMQNKNCRFGRMICAPRQFYYVTFHLQK